MRTVDRLMCRSARGADYGLCEKRAPPRDGPKSSFYPWLVTQTPSWNWMTPNWRRSERLGVRRPMAVGEYLYREGDASYDFYVVLAGVVEVVVSTEGKERVLARHGAGRFLGELNLLTGQRVFVSARVAEPGEVIAVPRDALRRLIATDASLSDKILAAFLARRVDPDERRRLGHSSDRLAVLA